MIADPRYAIAFLGKPTTAAAKRTALEGEALVELSANHVLARTLPEAFDVDSHQGLVTVPLATMHYLVLGGMTMDALPFGAGVHFALDPARLAKLFKDLDAAGTAWEPIKGQKEDALPKAATFLSNAISDLPLDQRNITISDLIYDDDPDNAQTDSWYDHLMPSMFASGEGGMDMLAQWGCITPEAFSASATGGRGDDIFTNATAQIESSVGRDISALPHPAQAAAVVRWFLLTRAPPGLEHFVVNATMEIERRAGSTIAERFEPLFTLHWRETYNLLAQLWPHPVSAIVIDTAGLMVSLGITSGSEGITPHGVRALITALHEYVPFATGSSNAERTKQVIHAHKHADDDKDESADTKAQLQADVRFQEFRTSIEKFKSDDHVEIAKEAMSAKHAAGILFLNGLLKDKIFKERAGAKTESILQAIFNTQLSVNTKGTSCPQWGAVLPEGVAKKFLAGKFAQMHFWNMFKPIILKREGAAVTERIDKRLATASAAAVFVDAEAMRFLETTVRAAMALIGFSSTDAYSFAALWKTLTRLASAIENLPTTCAPRVGLHKRMLEVAPQLMQDPQDRWECMLATPVTAVQRIGSFVVEGNALNAITALDSHVERIMKEVDDGLHGCAVDAANNVRERNSSLKQHEPPPKAEQRWGANAFKHGIYSSADGKRWVWGTQIVTDFETAPDAKKHCPALFAPNSSQHSWCSSPSKCWKRGGEKAHERLADFPKEVCKAKPIGNAAPPVNWDEMTVTIVSPEGGRGGGERNANGKRSREGDVRRQGKGAGKGAGKGKGKGGGRGGKGQGRRFGRQSQ